MKYSYLITLILSIFLFTGCATKPLNQIFIEKSKKHGVNHRTIKAICKIESGHRNNVVNVNKSIFDIHRGGHYFESAFRANLFMDYVLDPLFLNYDIGICQINKQHLKRLNLDNEDLLDPEINIDTAAKIYAYNVKYCKGDLVCALSVYNTGKKNSSIGRKYANKVIKQRKKY